MEQESSRIFGYSDIFFIHFLSEDTPCSQSQKSAYHFLVYVYTGELVIIENGIETIVGSGECVFIGRDHRLSFIKRSANGELYKGISMAFTRDFLRKYYQQIDSKYIPNEAKPLQSSILRLPDSPVIKSIFVSMVPYFNTNIKPMKESMDFKMQEGILALLFILTQKWFFVKFGAGYPELESTTFRLSSSNPALPYISLFLFFNLFT